MQKNYRIVYDRYVKKYYAQKRILLTWWKVDNTMGDSEVESRKRLVDELLDKRPMITVASKIRAVKYPKNAVMYSVDLRE